MRHRNKPTPSKHPIERLLLKTGAAHPQSLGPAYEPLIRKLGTLVFAVAPGSSSNQGAVFVTEYDRLGDGVILLQESGPDIPPVTRQWSTLQPLLNELGLTPRHVIACHGISATAPIRNRPDLLALPELVRCEWCRWFACLDIGSISLWPDTVETIREELAAANTSLYLRFPKGEVPADWLYWDIEDAEF